MMKSAILALGVFSVTFLVWGVSGQAVHDADPVVVGPMSKKKCKDVNGTTYGKNAIIYTTCKMYTCIGKGKGKKAKYGWKSEDIPGACCIIEGDYYPVGNLVSSVQSGPVVELDYICQPNTEGQLEPMAVLNVTGCSVDDRKLGLWEKIFWPEKCTQIECIAGMDGIPTLVYYPMAEGCDCCEFEGYLLADGDDSYDSFGNMVKCCKGVINFVFPWSENITGPVLPTEPSWGSWSSWYSSSYPSSPYTRSSYQWSSWGPWSSTGNPQGTECSDSTFPPWGSDCSCGQARSVQKIVGGQETEVNEFPWQALVTSDVLCGGTVISDRYVLTAAHCTEGRSASQITVTLGDHDRITSDETNSTRFGVCQIIDHPDYGDATSIDYDFSLLKLDEAINFNDYPNIRPACLPSDPTETFAGLTATVSGWGTLSSGGSLPDALHSAEVDVITNEACTTSPNQYAASQITDSMLCAERANTDSCQGDSGGPLVAQDQSTGKYQLIGVVSWGYGCADDVYPGVYARVTEVLEWIYDNAAEDWNTCDA